MNFLKNNQKLRIIPEEISAASDGVIQEVSSGYFAVLLDKTDNSLSIGSAIEVIIYTNDCLADDCLVVFTTKITAIQDNMVTFSIPEKFRYMQRREYTRININIPVILTDLSLQEEVNSLSENISGGGMQLKTPKRFDLNSTPGAKFSILNKKNIETVLKVLRTGKNDDKDYSLAGEFKKITNEDRTAIVQLCLKRQLELECKDVRVD